MAVLNVDDNDPARFFRTSLLQRGGYTVIEAATAEAARRAGAIPDSELVVLDIKLPDGSGFEVCSALKEARPSLPVIMISATYRTTQARLDGYAAGADAYLMEPVLPEQLLMLVRQFIGHRPEADAGHTAAWIVTDSNGRIQDISAGAAATLNLAVRGARDRLLTMFFSRQAKQVVAWEPNPASRSRLITNLSLNRITNVVVRDVGLSDVSGEATLVVGGTIPGGKTTAPNEIRGPSVQGGEKKKLGPGDVVHIPSKTAHQLLVDNGKQFTYAILKIDEK